MVVYTTDIGKVVKVNELDFQKDVKDILNWIVSDKDYSIADVTVDLLCEDITGNVSNGCYGMNDLGVKVIENVLEEFK